MKNYIKFLQTTGKAMAKQPKKTSQISGKSREGCVNDPFNGDYTEGDAFFTKRQLMAKMMAENNLKQTEIAAMMKISQQAVSKLLAKVDRTISQIEQDNIFE